MKNIMKFVDNCIEIEKLYWVLLIGSLFYVTPSFKTLMSCVWVWVPMEARS